MKRLFRFLTNLDKEASRAILISVLMFASVAGVYALGKFGLGVGDELTPEQWFEGVADSPWALPAVIAAFTALAFLGAPQFVLIAAAVVAFGPRQGALYSWVATMVAAAVTFGLGRFAGARAARRFGGLAVDSVSRFVGRNGFLSSMAIRNVPSAPFIVVNMGLGMSHCRWTHFLAGTGIGIIPKIVLVAFAGKGVMEVLLRAKSWEAAGMAAIGAAVWMLGMLAARRFVRRRESSAARPSEQDRP